MEDALYDTSWLLHRIPDLTPRLSALLTPSQTTPQDQSKQRHRLSSHADLFLKYLHENRPRYEDEEEKAKFGGIRQCTWKSLEILAVDGHDRSSEHQAGKKRKRYAAQDDGHSLRRGLMISLVYEKTTYKFVIYAASTGSFRPSKRSRIAIATSHTGVSRGPFGGEPEPAILLAKSSPSVLKTLTTYLLDTFDLPRPVEALKFPSSFIQSTLESHLTTIYRALSSDGDGSNASSNAIREYEFTNTVGTVKVTVSFSAPIAPSLKSLEVAVGLPALLSAFQLIDSTANARRETFLGFLSGCILAKTGLRLPGLDDSDAEKENVAVDETRTTEEQQAEEEGNAPAPIGESKKPDPPLRISRISTAAYAISVDQRLKFSLKAVEAVENEEDDDDLPSDDDENENHASDADVRENRRRKAKAKKPNSVRQANQELLLSILHEASRQGETGKGGEAA